MCKFSRSGSLCSVELSPLSSKLRRGLTVWSSSRGSPEERRFIRRVNTDKRENKDLPFKKVPFLDRQNKNQFTAGGGGGWVGGWSSKVSGPCRIHEVLINN